MVLGTRPARHEGPAAKVGVAAPMRQLRSHTRAARASHLGPDELRLVLQHVRASSLRSAQSVSKTWHAVATELFRDVEWQSSGCSLPVLIRCEEARVGAVKQRLELWSAAMESVVCRDGVWRSRLGYPAAHALGLDTDYEPGGCYCMGHVVLLDACRHLHDEIDTEMHDDDIKKEDKRLEWAIALGQKIGFVFEFLLEVYAGKRYLNVRGEPMHRGVLDATAMNDIQQYRAHTTYLVGLAQLHDGRHRDCVATMRPNVHAAKSAYGSSHRSTFHTMFQLARALSELGRYDEAGAFHREALEGRIALHGLDHPDVMASMCHLGDALLDARKYSEAEDLYRQELAISARVNGEEDRETLISLGNLIRCLMIRAAPEEGSECGPEAAAEAVSLCQRYIELATSLGEDEQETLKMRLQLATSIHYLDEDNPRADQIVREVHRQAEAKWRRGAPPRRADCKVDFDHAWFDLHADALSDLAECATDAGRLEEAEELGRRHLRLVRNPPDGRSGSMVDNIPPLQTSLQGLADLLTEAGVTLGGEAGRQKVAEAVDFFREALSVTAEELKDENVPVKEVELEELVIKTHLAEALLYLDEPEEAALLLAEAEKTHSEHVAPHGYLKPLGQDRHQDCQHLGLICMLAAIARESDGVPTGAAVRRLEKKVAALKALYPNRRKLWLVRRAVSALSRVATEGVVLQ